MNMMSKTGNSEGSESKLIRALQSMGGFARKETLMGDKFKMPESDIKNISDKKVVYSLGLPGVAGRDAEVLVLRNSDAALNKLEKLSERIQYLCGGKEDQHVGAYFEWLKEMMGGDDDRTVMGIAYALESRKIDRFDRFDSGNGPLYVATGTLKHYILTNADEIFHYKKKKD
ncbi:hypothetical protein HYT25_04625 [Candidatus Pacearchaeota archaeon]|nr:hypothetical protein [Candidatus Pacearchaeota archaeon]